MSKTLQIFDPAMCCSTGVCGPDVDPKLVAFAGDLAWVASQGVTVQRFNLAQQPGAFAECAPVKEALAKGGTAVLPILLLNGEIVTRAIYPSRDQLAAILSLGAGECCCGEPAPASAGDEPKSSCCCS